MNQAQALLAGLMVSLLAGTAHSEPGATEPMPAVPEFEIMSDAEVLRHRDRMAKLSEAAREAYRSAEYEKLKDRAEKEGYRLPEKPPWTEATSADSMETGETGLQLTAAGAGETSPSGPEPNEADRATMKQRFERHLQERAEQRADATGARPPSARRGPADEHLVGQRASTATQRAEQKTRIEERKAEMEARREGYRKEIQEKKARVETRAEQRQADFFNRRSATATRPSDSGPETRFNKAEFGEDPRARQVREQLERLREANAAERQKLQDEADQRIARQQAELESLRYRRRYDATVPSGSAAQASPPGTQIEAPESEPTEEAAEKAGPDTQPKPARSVAGAATASDAEGGAPAATRTERTEASAARPSASSSSYYRRPLYPRYPAVPYPAYPYFPNPYWTPPPR